MQNRHRKGIRQGKIRFTDVQAQVASDEKKAIDYPYQSFELGILWNPHLNKNFFIINKIKHHMGTNQLIYLT